MPLLQHQMKVIRRSRIEGGPHPYFQERVDRQYLVRETRLFGILVWRKTLDSEVIPQQALIDIGCFGASSWTSRFAEHISAQRAMQRRSA